jgi:hypothetical protein
MHEEGLAWFLFDRTHPCDQFVTVSMTAEAVELLCARDSDTLPRKSALLFRPDLRQRVFRLPPTTSIVVPGLRCDFQMVQMHLLHHAAGGVALPTLRISFFFLRRAVCQSRPNRKRP